MARIQERTSKDGTARYTATVRLKGYEPQAATFKRLTDAKKWIQDTESAIREGRFFKTSASKKHTVSALIERYIKNELPKKPKKLSDRIHQLKWWDSKIGHMVLADVTPDVLAQCRDELSQGLTQYGKPRAPATVIQYITAISPAFAVAVKEWRWLPDNPMSKITKPTEPRGRVRFLDDEERTKFLQACKESPNPMLYPCVILALSTGMRQAELMELVWKDVSLKDGFLILHETKNGERRRVALTGLALSILHEHAKIRRIDTPLIFPSDRNPQKPIDLRKAFATALKAAGSDNFHWHDLRHCTASYLAMNGASLAEIAEVLGHKTLSMVMRYAHLSDGHVSNVVASMNAKIFGGV
jgi:integrase